MQQFVTTPSQRYWSGRFLRVAQREILICSVYLPPGDLHCQARHATMQDLGTLGRQLRCCWILVGDWNQGPEEMANGGFPSFVHGAIVSTKRPTCLKGKDSGIDYAIVRRGLEAAVKLEVDEDGPWSPHLGIKIVVDVPRMDDKISTWRQVKAIQGDAAGASEHDWVSCHHFHPLSKDEGGGSGGGGKCGSHTVQVHHQYGTKDTELTADT